jgi:hypothetical protein
MIDISLGNDIFITNKVDAAVQELDMLFNTENTELIGYSDYGTNWWQYLWSLTPLDSDLERYVIHKIMDTMFVSQFNPKVTVKSEKGVENAIYYIKIELYTNDGETISVQQYELK